MNFDVERSCELGTLNDTHGRKMTLKRSLLLPSKTSHAGYVYNEGRNEHFIRNLESLPFYASNGLVIINPSCIHAHLVKSSTELDNASFIIKKYLESHTNDINNSINAYNELHKQLQWIAVLEKTSQNLFDKSRKQKNDDHKKKTHAGNNNNNDIKSEYHASEMIKTETNMSQMVVDDEPVMDYLFENHFDYIVLPKYLAVSLFGSKAYSFNIPEWLLPTIRQLKKTILSHFCGDSRLMNKSTKMLDTLFKKNIVTGQYYLENGDDQMDVDEVKSSNQGAIIRDENGGIFLSSMLKVISSFAVHFDYCNFEDNLSTLYKTLFTTDDNQNDSKSTETVINNATNVIPNSILSCNVKLRTMPVNQCVIVVSVVKQMQSALSSFVSKSCGLFLQDRNIHSPGLTIFVPCGVGKTQIAVTSWLALPDARLFTLDHNNFGKISFKQDENSPSFTHGSGITTGSNSILQMMGIFKGQNTSSTDSHNQTLPNKSDHLIGCKTYDQWISKPANIDFASRSSHVIKKHVRLLWVVFSDILVNQSFQRINQVVANVRVGKLKGSKRPNPCDYDVVVASLKTICVQDDFPAGYFESFGMLVMDECHETLSTEHRKVYNKVSCIPLCLALTATPRDHEIRWFVGPVVVASSRPKLKRQQNIIVMRSGLKAEERPLYYANNLNMQMQDHLAKVKYQYVDAVKMDAMLAYNMDRNQFVCDVLISLLFNNSNKYKNCCFSDNEGQVNGNVCVSHILSSSSSQYDLWKMMPYGDGNSVEKLYAENNTVKCLLDHIYRFTDYKAGGIHPLGSSFFTSMSNMLKAKAHFIPHSQIDVHYDEDANDRVPLLFVKLVQHAFVLFFMFAHSVMEHIKITGDPSKSNDYRLVRMGCRKLAIIDISKLRDDHPEVMKNICFIDSKHESVERQCEGFFKGKLNKRSLADFGSSDVNADFFRKWFSVYHPSDFFAGCSDIIIEKKLSDHSSSSSSSSSSSFSNPFFARKSTQTPTNQTNSHCQQSKPLTPSFSPFKQYDFYCRKNKIPKKNVANAQRSGPYDNDDDNEKSVDENGKKTTQRPLKSRATSKSPLSSSEKEDVTKKWNVNKFMSFCSYFWTPCYLPFPRVISNTKESNLYSIEDVRVDLNSIDGCVVKTFGLIIGASDCEMPSELLFNDWEGRNIHKMKRGTSLVTAYHSGCEALITDIIIANQKSASTGVDNANIDTVVKAVPLAGDDEQMNGRGTREQDNKQPFLSLEFADPHYANASIKHVTKNDFESEVYVYERRNTP